MNRLDFFKWLGKGAAVVVAAPLSGQEKIMCGEEAIFPTRKELKDDTKEETPSEGD